MYMYIFSTKLKVEQKQKALVMDQGFIFTCVYLLYNHRHITFKSIFQ